MLLVVVLCAVPMAFATLGIRVWGRVMAMSVPLGALTPVAQLGGELVDGDRDDRISYDPPAA